MGREIVGRGHRKSFCFPARKFKAVRGTTTKVKLSTEHTPLVSKTKILCIVHNADLTKVYPVVKKNYRKNNSISAISRSLKAFREFLGNVNKRSRHFICSNIFLQKTISEKNTRKYLYMSLVQEISGGYDNFGDAAKGSYFSGSERSEERFSGQLAPSWETRWGYCAVISVKELNKHIPYQHFKMEDLHYLKFML